MVKEYHLGHLSFSIEGGDPTLPYIQEEFQPIIAPSGSKRTKKLHLHFGAVPTPPSDSVYVSPFICSEKELLYKGVRFHYHLTEKEKALYLTIQSQALPSLQKKLPKVSRLKDWNYLLPVERVAKDFMYNIFDYISQIQQLKVQQSYFHASSFQKGDRAIAMIAWGGVGKTTSMLKLVTEDGWKFLSDDLGIIDTHGILYRSPKKMQIYAYNLVGQPAFKKLLLDNRSLPDRVNWLYKKKLYGIKRARRRISAEALFGENKVAKKAKLTDAFFIERTNTPQFQITTIPAAQLATRAATTVMHEINPYQSVETALYTAQKKALLPRYTDLYTQTQNILEQAFSNARLRLIKIPLKATPDDLANFLRKTIDQ